MKKGERIYLDHATAGLLLPAVRREVGRVLRERPAAPGGGHREGREAREEMEKARERVATFLGAKEVEGVVFTSGGTEAVQSALQGWAEAVGSGVIYVSEMEHPAVESAVRRLAKKAFRVVRVAVDGEGRLLWKGVKKEEGQGLVCLHLAQHDLGTCQSVAEAKIFAEKAGAKLFIDGCFGAGWTELEVDREGADLVAISGHRLGGPKGSGALWLRAGTPWVPWLEGGRQEGDRRAGTENLAAIVGLGVAAEEWFKNGAKFRKKGGQVQRALAEGIQRRISTARLHGPRVGGERSVAQLAFSFAGLEAESLALVLDRVGLAARGGSGCVTREMRIPPAMKAIGAKPEEARALILFTMGPGTAVTDMPEAVERVGAAVERLTAALPSAGI